jgi:hypothetical protein
MRVVGVDLEPLQDAVAARLAVRPLSDPLLLGHPIENCGGRLSSRFEGVERRADRTIVMELSRELFLIVAANHRPVFSEQTPEADRRRHLAVGEVMDDLARGPFARRRPAIEVGVGCSLERSRHLRVTVLVLRH